MKENKQPEKQEQDMPIGQMVGIGLVLGGPASSLVLIPLMGINFGLFAGIATGAVLLVVALVGVGLMVGSSPKQQNNSVASVKKNQQSPSTLFQPGKAQVKSPSEANNQSFNDRQANYTKADTKKTGQTAGRI